MFGVCFVVSQWGLFESEFDIGGDKVKKVEIWECVCVCRESDREREERERRGKERGRDFFLMLLFKFWELVVFEVRNIFGYFSKVR